MTSSSPCDVIIINYKLTPGLESHVEMNIFAGLLQHTGGVGAAVAAEAAVRVGGGVGSEGNPSAGRVGEVSANWTLP